jgi:drug/metabolite transporter (DMT)-like permease
MKSEHPLRGIMLIAAAVLLFSCLDTSIKYLTAYFSVPLLAFVRYVVHVVLMVTFLGRSEGARLLRANRPWLVAIRGLSLAALTLFMTLALKRIPVAEATAIGFVAPLLVVVLARPLLGEKIGVLRWLTVLAGFAGVLLIARPSGDLDPLGVTYVLCGTSCATVYQLLSRVLARNESTNTMLFYAGIAGVLFFALGLPLQALPTSISWQQGLLLFSLGITGGLGHYLFTRAYRYAPASLLAPFTYLQLLWAAGLGWLVFGRIPHHLTLVGMLIIAASGVVLAVQQSRR